MSTEIRPDLVDRMIELYCDWRTACWDVRAAYDRFIEAPASDRAVAFAAYTAALDREESSCDAYAAQVRTIQSRYSKVAIDAHRPHAKLR
ncbi:MAG TPA: hypothetical protein VMA96_15270 [Solirubrobacteraceae bacterium]|nr:hypothetical protein [Solirubrobacteraceae bacterium]